jgi:hypothetical protein
MRAGRFCASSNAAVCPVPTQTPPTMRIRALCVPERHGPGAAPAPLVDPTTPAKALIPWPGVSVRSAGF